MISGFVNRVSDALSRRSYRLRYAVNSRVFALRSPSAQVCSDKEALANGAFASFKGAPCAVIVGNGPNLDSLDRDSIAAIESGSGFSIGINRSYLRVRTDALVWFDKATIRDIMKHRFDRPTKIVQVTGDGGFPRQHELWVAHRRLGFEYPGLYFLRNSLVPALHLCWILGIRHIVLVGIQLDNRAHFYPDRMVRQHVYPASGKLLPFEQNPDEVVESTFKGYHMQRAVAEVVTSMVSDGRHIISFFGESHFLSGLGYLNELPSNSALREHLRSLSGLAS